MLRARFLGFAVAAALTAPLAGLTDPLAALAAEPAPPEVDWSAPPECPTQAQLQSEIDSLRARPKARARGDARVSAEVTRDQGGVGPYRLRLVIADREGAIRERRIEGETCSEIAFAAAVIVTLASDDTSLAAEPSPIPETPVEAPRRDRSEPEGAPAAARPVPAAPRPWVWDVTALGGVDFATLPAPAPGFGLGVAGGLGADRVELRATAWLPARATLSRAMLTVPEAVGGDVALYAGALRYCRSLFTGTLDLAPCGGVEAGALVASSVGLAPPTRGVAPWLAPEIGLTGEVRPSSRIALTLELDGLVPLARARFVVSSGVDLLVFQPPRVTGRAVLGLRLRLP